MKVWFGTTTTELQKYKEHYFAIRNYLKQSGCYILFDWLDEAVNYKLQNPTGKRNIKNIYKEISTAISNADAVIIEYTIPNFSSSEQINQAIFKRKPTLVMRLHKDNTYSDSYIEAIESPYLTVVEYTMRNYKKVIDEFLGYSKLEKGSGRYNIVLDKTHKYYLEWASKVEKKSMSSILRALIENKMKADDRFKP